MELTVELRNAIRENPDSPLELIDSETNRSYRLVPSELFDRIRELVAIESNAFVEGGYQLSMEAFRSDWDDPAMDVYDALDPRKGQ